MAFNSQSSLCVNRNIGSDSDRGRPVLEPSNRCPHSSSIRLNRLAIMGHFFPDLRLYECAVAWGLTGNHGMSVACWNEAKGRERAAECHGVFALATSTWYRESGVLTSVWCRRLRLRDVIYVYEIATE